MLQKVQSPSNIQYVSLAKLILDVSTRNPGTKPDETFTYVDLSAVDQERKAIIGARVVLGSEAPSRARQVIYTNDVLISTVRPNLNGVALVPKDYDDAIASTGFCVLRPNKKLLDPIFLFHWVRSPAFVTEMVRRATGASYPAVSDLIVHQSLIPCPSLPEQRRIAAILDQADALWAKRREALAKLDEMAQAIFVEMFGDPGSEFHKYPSGRLGAVCELINGDRSSNYPSGDDLVECGVPFLSTKNIRGAEFDLSNCNFITEQKFKSLSRGKLKRHDLVITLRGTLGQCAEFDCRFETGFINAQMMIIRPNPKLLSGYVREFIANPYTQAKLQRVSSGSAVPQLTAKEVGELSIPVPPLDIQRLFFHKLSELSGLVKRCREGLDKTDNLFSSLQHHAFSGDL